MRTLFVVLFVFCTSCSLPFVGPQPQVAPIPNADRLLDAHWGILARSMRDGRVIWARGEKLHFSPASNLKLFTTAVSLLRLGPDYRYITNVSLQGKMEEGIINGDLVIRASGDPTLSSYFGAGGAVAVFEKWADDFVQQGIREVSGNIIVDDSLFDTQYMGTGWFWDDATSSYSAQISAFSINDNCVELQATAGGKIGEPGTVGVMPRTGYVTVVNRTVTISSGKSYVTCSRQAGSNTIIVSGTLSIGDQPKRLWITVHQPSLYGATVLKEVLESKGIVVRGTVGIAQNDDSTSSPPIGQVLASHSSPPLWLIVQRINKWSHNLSAELLFRTLGAVYYGKGSTSNGTRVMVETIEGAGIVPKEIRLSDGSGLSRLSMVTPSQVVNLLEFMYHQSVFAYFYNSLPIAGVDGTLAERAIGKGTGSNVRAKTGSSTHTASLSGYLKRRDGEMVAFSFLTNNNLKPSGEIREIQDSLCEGLSK